MSSNFQTDFTSIGIEKNYLYEILATTFSKDNNLMVPNTACMGVRLVDKNLIKIWPYPNTTTYKNIESGKFLILNFIDDVYLYALASLKGSDISKSVGPLSEKYYNYYTLSVKDEYKDFTKSITSTDSIRLPYLKQAWAIIICIATNKNQILRKDDFGKSKVMEINLSVISYEKFKESFKLYNRAENLTLETIVLVTKLNIATEKKDKTLIGTIKRKIEENLSEIQRFGKNESAIKAIEHVKNYINELEL
ncbi:MAG: DUF447 family protein [Candidatus Lokiarchaeota archaeon]|nr:DUF447 family protein [Candidatus Lokiarchaeota archaeon]